MIFFSSRLSSDTFRIIFFSMQISKQKNRIPKTLLKRKIFKHYTIEKYILLTFFYTNVLIRVYYPRRFNWQKPKEGLNNWRFIYLVILITQYIVEKPYTSTKNKEKWKLTVIKNLYIKSNNVQWLCWVCILCYNSNSSEEYEMNTVLRAIDFLFSFSSTPFCW